MELLAKDTNVSIKLSEAVFSCDYNEGLIHQSVVTYLNNARQGDSAQKTRAEVRGGGKKPWRQKGTGRARAGTIRSPIWRGGGVTFASKKRDYTLKLNKKMYRKAINTIFSALFSNNRLSVVESFLSDAPKTKTFLAKMKDLNLTSALIITDHLDENTYLSSRNLFNFYVCDVQEINPYLLLKYEHVIVTSSALKEIEELFA